MKTRTWITGALIALAGVIVLAACGGGSSMGSSPGSASGTAGTSGIVTGFGSVFVNGREFTTGSATQVVDGDNDDAPSSTAALQVGMNVDLDADGKSATWLRFTSAVKGEIDAIDTTASTVTVLGQTVRVTSGTSFAGGRTAGSGSTPITQLGDLKLGDYVVVFGYLECPGMSCAAGTDIVATLINEPPAPGKYRVQGFVSNFNAMSGSFIINGLTVDFTTSGMGMGMASTVCMPAGCAFANGDFVSVRSNSPPTGTFSAGASTLTLAASDIRRRPQVPSFTVGETVTLEGPVTQLGAAGFVVRGVSVDASAPSLASTLAGLANNQIVEVTGTVSSMGTLVASTITVERHATFSLLGALDAAPGATLSVLGQSFSVDSTTRFVDWAQGVRPFNSGNFAMVLKAGDQVIVSGFPAPAGGSNIATRVERIPTPGTPTAGVQAIVSTDSPQADTLSAAGITVTLNSSTQLFYMGAGGMPTLAGFFAAITPNTSVVIAVGSPGPGAGAITAADAAAMRPGSRWSD